MDNVQKLTKLGALGLGVSIYATRKLDKSQLIELASDLDAKSFSRWFLTNGVTYEQIAAMWLTESSGNPRATNFTGGDGAQGGAWGLGQVTALTSTDYGLIMPAAPLMLFPRIGGRISMTHIRAIITGLRNQGFAGDFNQWVQAYNVGLTGYINGRRNADHLARFVTHLLPINLSTNNF